MKEFICVSQSYDVATRMTHAEQCNTDVENMDVWSDDQEVASNNLDEHGKDEDPLATVFVAKPTNRYQSSCHNHTNKVASTNKTDPLLGLTDQVELFDPIVDVLAVVFVGSVRWLWEATVLTYRVLAARLPRAILRLARKMMRLTLEKWHADHKKVDRVAAN